MTLNYACCWAFNQYQLVSLSKWRGHCNRATHIKSISCARCLSRWCVCHSLSAFSSKQAAPSSACIMHIITIPVCAAQSAFHPSLAGLIFLAWACLYVHLGKALTLEIWECSRCRSTCGTAALHAIIIAVAHTLLPRAQAALIVLWCELRLLHCCWRWPPHTGRRTLKRRSNGKGSVVGGGGCGKLLGAARWGITRRWSNGF